MPEETLLLIDFEDKFVENYGCWHTYTANHIFRGYALEEMKLEKEDNGVCSLSNRQLQQIHNKNTINLIFPNENFRLTCSRSFALNILPIHEIIHGPWDKLNVIESVYRKEDGESCKGAINVIIKNEMSSLIFSNSVCVMRTSYHPRTRINNVKRIETYDLYNFIIENFEEQHYRDTYTFYGENNEYYNN